MNPLFSVVEQGRVPLFAKMAQTKKALPARRPVFPASSDIAFGAA
jgi:hypothetical protein